MVLPTGRKPGKLLLNIRRGKPTSAKAEVLLVTLIHGTNNTRPFGAQRFASVTQSKTLLRPPPKVQRPKAALTPLLEVPPQALSAERGKLPKHPPETGRATPWNHRFQVPLRYKKPTPLKEASVDSEWKPLTINGRGSYDFENRKNRSYLSPKRCEDYDKKFWGKTPKDFSSWRYQKLCLWYNHGLSHPTKRNNLKRKALMQNIHQVAMFYMKVRRTLGLRTYCWYKRASWFIELTYNRKALIAAVHRAAEAYLLKKEKGSRSVHPPGRNVSLPSGDALSPPVIKSRDHPRHQTR